MSGRRQVQHRHDSLADIREILSAMKSLALMETQKLTRRAAAQRAIVTNIELAASDFLHAFGDLQTTSPSVTEVEIIVGTERGFCGDFNEALLGSVAARRDSSEGEHPIWLAVGRKLHEAVPRGSRVSRIDGAGVAGEVGVVLDRIVAELDSLRSEFGPLRVVAHFHDPLDDAVVSRPVLPPLQALDVPVPEFTHPPALNLTPSELFVELADHHVFAMLHEILYLSLLCENERRVGQLTGAVRHLDERLEGLVRLANRLRQEEIIEEIEVILLSGA